MTAQDRNQQDAAFARALVPLLRSLKLDRANRKQLGRLCKRLKAVDRGLPLQPVLTETTALLNAFSAPHGQPSSLTEGSATDQYPGLLKRLFGFNEPGAEIAPPEPPPKQPQDHRSASALQHLLMQIDTGASGADRLRPLQEHAADCRDQAQAQAQALLKETAAVISELLAPTTAEDRQSLAAQDALPGAATTLPELMTRIEIPHQLQPRLAEVRTRILQAGTVEQVPVVVQSIADLMSEIRRQVQKEKRDLEIFPEGVTNRIQVLSEKKPVQVTVSCGVAAFGDGDDPQSVFKRADAALYDATHAGRNRTHLEQDPTAHAIKRSIA